MDEIYIVQNEYGNIICAFPKLEMAERYAEYLTNVNDYFYSVECVDFFDNVIDAIE